MYCVYIIIVIFLNFPPTEQHLSLQVGSFLACVEQLAFMIDEKKIILSFLSQLIGLYHLPCPYLQTIHLALIQIKILASKVILFQESLGVVNAINICYTQQSSNLQTRVPSSVTWAIGLVPIETLNHIIHQCLFNRQKKYWLLSNALFVALAIMGMMRKDHARQTYVIPPLKCREFD